jgi:hypothetical protein
LLEITCFGRSNNINNAKNVIIKIDFINVFMIRFDLFCFIQLEKLYLLIQRYGEIEGLTMEQQDEKGTTSLERDIRFDNGATGRKGNYIL